jgi:hypothetical protein
MARLFEANSAQTAEAFLAFAVEKAAQETPAFAAEQAAQAAAEEAGRLGKARC